MEVDTRLVGLHWCPYEGHRESLFPYIWYLEHILQVLLLFTNSTKCGTVFKQDESSINKLNSWEGQDKVKDIKMHVGTLISL